MITYVLLEEYPKIRILQAVLEFGLKRRAREIAKLPKSLRFTARCLFTPYQQVKIPVGIFEGAGHPE